MYLTGLEPTKSLSSAATSDAYMSVDVQVAVLCHVVEKHLDTAGIIRDISGYIGTLMIWQDSAKGEAAGG